MFCDTLKVGYLDKDRILCRHIWKLYPECYLQKLPHQMIACTKNYVVEMLFFFNHQNNIWPNV